MKRSNLDGIADVEYGAAKDHGSSATNSIAERCGDKRPY